MVIKAREVRPASRLTAASYACVTPPEDVPPAAVGFLARRPDRRERFAAYTPAGLMINSFGLDLTIEEVAANLSGSGFTVDEAGNIFRKEG